MAIKYLSFSFLILLSFIIYTNANSWDCIYNMYVQTANFPSAGTSSNISIFLGDEYKDEFPIISLKDWGLMGSAHSYFRQGQVDLFAGKGPCLRGPVCSLIIVLNGFDPWFCDTIEITTVGFGKSSSQKNFVVQKWLDVNRGSAVILQDECVSVAPSSTTLRSGN